MRNLYVLLMVIVLCSCSNEDDTTVTDVLNPTSSIQGTWNLINISGGFAGINQDFEKGTIIWDFDESNGMVTITNNSTITGVYDGFASGTYTFSIVAPADIETLVVNDISLGFLTAITDNFSVSQQFRDGFQIRFER